MSSEPVQDTTQNESDSEAKVKQDQVTSEKCEPTDTNTPTDNEEISPNQDICESDKVEDERAQSSDGDVSPEIGGNRSARSRKNDPVLPPGSHRVTFTITIAQAYRTAEDEDGGSGGGGGEDGGKRARKKRVMDAPRAQNHFHFEYQLIPDEDEVKTDVVTYGVAAKIYTDKMEPKVLKTWQDGDYTWVAWTHTHTLTMTEDALMKLYNHKLELRIWDTKDKLSTRARFDRPRAFRLPQSKSGQEEDFNGVRGIVMKQSKNFETQQPKKPEIDYYLPHMDRSRERIARNDPEQRDRNKKAANNLENIPSKLNQYLEGAGHKPQDTLMQINDKQEPDNDDEEVKRTYSRLGKLAGVSTPKEPSKPSNKSPSRNASRTKTKTADTDNFNALQSKSSSNLYESNPDLGSSYTTLDDRGEKPARPPGASARLSSAEKNNQREGATGSAGAGSGRNSKGSSKEELRGKRQRNKKAEAAAAALAEHIKKHGLCVIPIKLSKLFSGTQIITERLERPINEVCDVFFTVSLNGPLMTEEQRQALNPLVVKVHSATNMPDTPLSYEELRLRCEASYIKYQFFNQPTNLSVGKPQDKDLYWDDINVVLAGTISPAELREYLQGPALEIEVHDRDRIQEKRRLEPTLFGDDLEDEKISNVGTVSSKRTLHNAFKEEKEKPWDPYGIARFDLSGLLLGQQVMHLKSPIHLCPPPDVLGAREEMKDGRLVGVPGAVDGPVDSPLKGGHYLDSHAMLKIKVELAYPLVTPQQLASKMELETTKECPFSRIVFKFNYKNTAFLQSIEQLVIDINAKALGLQEMPAHVIETALSTYKLSYEQQVSRQLDIVTGFHLMDGNMHLFVLEGLRDQAIQLLWEELPKPFDTDVEVLYNSDLSFKDRLYGPLDVDVCSIKLHEPLDIIVQQPLLYVRDMVPKPCFQALVKLHNLALQNKLSDVTRNDLFPSAEMVQTMSKEFGVPLTQDDIAELQHNPTDNKAEEEEGVKFYNTVPAKHPTRQWTPIDNYNEKFDSAMEKRERDSREKNYHADNVEMIKKQSDKNSEERAKNKPLTVKVEAGRSHNYSTQYLNSTEQAKEQLRNVLAEEPDRRFTYCPDYHHSMTVVPVNVEALKKEEKQALKDAYKTPTGWIYPGKKTMIQSNLHPKKPDPARVDELYEEWNENSLHSVHLEPTLKHRECYNWSVRHADMDIWTRPAGVFGVNDPITIHLAGQKRQGEKLEAARKDHETWKSKVIVDDERGYFHRILPETELRDKGFKSSNQLDRLNGMLKDPPMKYSLHKPGYNIKEIPPLNVVLNPSVDTAGREAGISTRPASRPPAPVKGFHPGPYKEYSWSLERNQIPVRDYEHAKYREAKGHDFNVYHKERSSMYKRPIPPLNDRLQDKSMFRYPSKEQYTIQFPRSYAMPEQTDIQKHVTQSLSAPPLPKVSAANGRKHVTIQSADSGLGPSLPSSLLMKSREETLLSREATSISGFGSAGLRKEAISAL